MNTTNTQTYQTLWAEAIHSIDQLAPGTYFALRDLISSPPPATLGVKLFKCQDLLGIKFAFKSRLSNVYLKNVATPTSF